MRDTSYATEIRTGILPLGSSNDARIERLHVKETDELEIRFSWWKEGKLMMRPLDLSEDDLIVLFENAISDDVFTPEFRTRLRNIL